MTKITFNCCGKQIEVEMVGEGHIRCPKCRRRIRRLFDTKSDTYIFKPEKGKKK